MGVRRGVPAAFATLALLAVAPQAHASEVKFKSDLFACIELGEDAGGEVEYEEESGLKVEVEGLRQLAGRSLVVVLDGDEIGGIRVDDDGTGSLLLRAFRLDASSGPAFMPMGIGGDDFEQGDIPFLSTDCDRVS